MRPPRRRATILTCLTSARLLGVPVKRTRTLWRDPRCVLVRLPCGEARVPEYHLSDAGRELRPVIEALGAWGVRWAFQDPQPEELDAGLLVWKIHQRINRERLPQRRTVVEFDFTGPRARRVWLMDRGIPTEEVLAEMRRADPPVQYLVGTPKGRLNLLEHELLDKPWQAARPGVQVKLLPRDGELYVFAESADRVAKERSMRRRQLKWLWARLKEWRAVATRYEKTARSFMGVLCLAATFDWIKKDFKL